MNKLTCYMYPIAKCVIHSVHSNTLRFFGRVSSVILLLFIFSSNGNAQALNDASLKLEPMNSTFYVDVADTVNINEIEVSLGAKSEQTDIFNYVFVYDQTTSLPNGCSYQRNGHNIALSLGELQYPLTVFARIRLKTSGQWGDWFSFVAN